MIYGSVCSGIEAASVAWEGLGYSPAWFSEIEPFPSSLLQQRFPHVQNLGDMTKIHHLVKNGEVEAPDILVGGTPCQAFSIAGMRKGLEDERGLLTMKFVELADEIDRKREEQGKPPTIVVWENVKGVLHDKSNAFGIFLAGLAGEDCELQPAGEKWTNAGCVYGPKRAIAWRLLDAQYFGVAQRRPRILLVACPLSRANPAEILFEWEGSRRDSAPPYEEKVNALSRSKPRATWWNDGQVSQTLDAVLYKKQCLPEKNRFPVVRVPIWDKCDSCDDYFCNVHNEHAYDCECPTLEEFLEKGVDPYEPTLYRYLLPVECELLQGFPADWTEVIFRGKVAADTVRYKAIGNSMPVPVMRWVGERIKIAIGG